jgi:hypothetical protein
MAGDFPPPDDPEFKRMAQQGAESHRYFRDMAELSWDKAELGELPDPPEWAFTPESALRFPVGGWVRFKHDVDLMSGQRFSQGEVARIVTQELHPNGAVTLNLRGSDRRFMMTDPPRHRGDPQTAGQPLRPRNRRRLRTS